MVGRSMSSPVIQGLKEPNHEYACDPLVLPNSQTPKRLRTAGKGEECAERRRASFRDVASFSDGTDPLDCVVAIDNAAMG